MSNFFELIQNISKDFLGRYPATFAETINNKKYIMILREIKQANSMFIMDANFSFRNKKASLNTIVGQQKYAHIYDTITDFFIKNDDGTTSDINFVSNYKEFLKRKLVAGKPTEYTIYDNKIYLYPEPDAVYPIDILHLTRNGVKGVYTLDATSEQNKLYLSSTVGLFVGQSLTIEPDTNREETVIISGITENDYITTTNNLLFTHNNGVAEVYKRSFEYEKDEPNFPKEYHDIIEYAALERLYYDDRDNLLKFNNLYKNMYTTILMETRQSRDNKLYFST